MAKSRPLYLLEFRARMAELVQSGRRPEELAQEFEPTARSIRDWVTPLLLADRLRIPSKGRI